MFVDCYLFMGEEICQQKWARFVISFIVIAIYDPQHYFYILIFISFNFYLDRRWVHDYNQTIYLLLLGGIYDSCALSAGQIYV